MFWDNVKSEVDYQGITYKELSDRTGLLLQSIYNGISKHSSPNVEAAYKVAKALNVSVEYLMTGNSYSELNNDELEVVRLYKLLPEDKKSMVKMLLSSISIDK